MASTRRSEPTPPDDLHELVAFEDPNEDRTWVFDATWLLSNWTCIYGRGCQGILPEAAPELHQGCCSYGAHLIDDADLASVTDAVERLDDAHWQMRRAGRRSGWLTTEADGTRITRVVDGACIFLNRPGFAAGAGCAFHIAALDAGERPMDWKPDVCWQVPIRLQEHTDDHGHVTSTVREWKRRDWGEAGHEFAWWCNDDASAFVGHRPTYLELRDELTELCGEAVFNLMAEQLERRRGNARTGAVPLPHPAVRRG